MKMLTFAGRNAKEILRDPLNLAFGLGFPMVVLLLLSAIQASIPVPLFEIRHLTPGITVFGLSFMSLFCATLISRDRSSALLQRLYTTPMTPMDFILGYTLPAIPIAVIQTAVCFGAAMVLGLEPSIHILTAIVLNLPTSLLFIGFGLLCGSVFTDKQVGGICGALLTNLTAWLSGAWFDLELVGGVFRDVAYALPFVHAVELQRAILIGDYSAVLPHILWVLGYATVSLAAAIGLFLRQMKKH